MVVVVFWLLLLLVVLLLWAPLSAIAGPAADLMSSLPGQPNVSFAQYAGYITVDAAAGRSFFYYFVEAQTDPSSQPLTLWLNGGPGCSSIAGGGFIENGPFRASSRSGGWIAARDNFVFLQNWFEAFPEYKGREFYITGESYAGHYVPQLTALVLDYIAGAGTSVINLVAMAIGNPLLDGLVDFAEQVFFFWTHGLISDSTYTSVMANCSFSVLAIPSEACDVAYAELQREVSDFADVYDVLIDVCLAPSMQQALKLERSRRANKRLKSSSSPLDVCIDDELVAYMNLPAVQQAFHANTTGLSYRWYYCNEGSLDYDESSEDDSMLPVLSQILESGIPILVYSGDEDAVIPFGGTRRLMDQLAKMNDLNTTVPYSAWFDGGQVGGWTQVYGHLSYATVRGAGHMVPYTSPGRALTLFQSFLAGVSLPLMSATAQLQIAGE